MSMQIHALKIRKDQNLYRSFFQTGYYNAMGKVVETTGQVWHAPSNPNFGRMS